MDKYDEAVEYLTDNPDQITEAWLYPYENQGGELFKCCNESGTADRMGTATATGCLTQIRSFNWKKAWNPEVTKAIQDDKRIPNDMNSITIEDLPVFAEWQRKLDNVRELERQMQSLSDVLQNLIDES